MTRPEDGGAKPPLVTYIVHKKTHGTKCDICQKEHRIAVYILDSDAEGLYVFYDICLCLKCLRKGQRILQKDSYGTVSTEYVGDHEVHERYKKYGDWECDHCKNTPYFNADKKTVQFINDPYYQYEGIYLCKGCIDYMIKMLEDVYNPKPKYFPEPYTLTINGPGPEVGCRVFEFPKVNIPHDIYLSTEIIKDWVNPDETNVR